MAKVNINCPKCKARFKVDEASIGKKGRCQKCGERFVISWPEENQKLGLPVKPKQPSDSAKPEAKESEDYRKSDKFLLLKKHLLDDSARKASVPKDVPPASIERIRLLFAQLKNLSKPTGKDGDKAAALIELLAESMLVTILNEPSSVAEAEVSKAGLAAWTRACHSASWIFGKDSERVTVLLEMYAIAVHIIAERFNRASNKTNCFIATAACGTEDALDVVRLREFRDVFLRRSSMGRSFICFYEHLSPSLARCIARSAYARAIVRNCVVAPARWLADRVLDDRRN